MYICWLFRGSTSDEATQDIINTQIPAIADLCSSGQLHVDNIDVFCEKGVFNTDQTREVLQTGKQAGWNINFHGDELHSMNSGEVCNFVYVWLKNTAFVWTGTHKKRSGLLVETSCK